MLRCNPRSGDEMRKTIPTLLLAVSLGAGMILVSEAAFARNNGNHDHNDHQGNSGMRGGNTDRSGASQTNRIREVVIKNEKGKAKGTGAGTGTGGTASSGGKWKVTHGGNPPRSPVISKKPPTPAPTTKPPAKGAPSAGLPAGTAVVSNGRVKLYIPNSSSGLTVTKNASGTITVSNGDPTHSVTLPGGSVTVSGGGVTNVGGAAGVQVIRQANGDFAAAASAPAAAPPKSAPTTKPGTVTGGPKGGFVGALGSGIVDGVKGAGKAVANGAESVITAGSPRPGSPAAGAPKTSTTTQQ
jgi:hypothetical protein